MEKQFVTYEIALKLKELGFDEECLARYEGINWLGSIKEWTGHKLEITITPSQDTFSWQIASAPLWQQCINWFRENYGINIHITVYSLVSNTYGFELMSIFYQTISTLRTGCNSEHFYGEIIEYKSYEEAREQAILKCIELLKNK